MSEGPAHDVFTRTVRLTLEGMDRVRVQRDLPYRAQHHPDCLLDVYSPGDASSPSPAVVIVTGYPLPYRKIGWTTSMCRLLAASGVAAVAYGAAEPVDDLRAVFDHVTSHAEELGLEATRLGVLAVSGNVPTALTTLLRHDDRRPVCAAFAYGALLDLDGSSDVAQAARQFGFANPTAGRQCDDLRGDVPLLIVRAGRDEFTAMNASIDRFVSRALARNLPVSLVNYPEGIHAFDLFDESRSSKNAVRAVLQFCREHLLQL
jgi:acetyl esterase/lipase